MVIKCVLLVICYHLLLGAASEFTPTVYPAKVISFSQCGQRNSLHDQQLIEVLKQVQQQLPCHPALNTSCMDIHNACPSAPSGYYSIRAANGSAVQVYCDMEGTNCGGEGGWTRVAYVNMSQPGATCPQGLDERNFTGEILCGRIRNVTGCSEAVFPTPVEYSQVCGQLVGYQSGDNVAFRLYNQNPLSHWSIDRYYVDGVSITYGSGPRKHIWTYAVAIMENWSGNLNCPCNQLSQANTPPFVGNDYYCESGTPNLCCQNQQFYPNDTLWDGKQCGSSEAPCCTHPNLPWFLKILNKTTTENIDLRLCGAWLGPIRDTPLRVIELFVR